VSHNSHFFYVEDEEMVSFDGFLFLIDDWNEVNFRFVIKDFLENEVNR